MSSDTIDIVWRPTPAYTDSSALAAFMRAHGIPDYETLNRRSAEDPAWYWDAVIKYFNIRFTRPYRQVLDVSKGAPWAEWCVGGATNLAFNCLDKWGGTSVMGRPAVIWEGEDGRVREWMYLDLNAETCRLARALKALGVQRGEAVGIYMPMLPETVAAFFAIAKIGAIAVPLFSGFGPDAIVSRLEDAGAVAVLTVDATRRRGHLVPLKATLDEAARRLPALRHIIVLDSYGTSVPWTPGRDHHWREITAGQPAGMLTEDTAADDRFMVIFTSGTTGKAKGTVHTHCGFVTKLASDFGLVLDFKPTDRMLWMSDLGWLVGPMQIVVTTFFGGTLVLAEGTPDYPIPGRLWKLVQDHRVSYLGVAPTVARALMAYGGAEVAKYDLSCLRAVVSSGELWNPDSWLWFFEHVCRRQVPMLNVSGGTEIGWGIVSCTVLHPMKPCAFTGSMPGMAADIVDAEGQPVPPGQMGELVLRQPSIGLSRGLWHAPERYLEAYWTKIPGLWVHGDWASRDRDGFWYLHGRSDDTIMVAGKRCGPSEVESLLMATGKVAEAAATGVDDPLKGESVLCVCVAKAGVEANDELARNLKDAVVKGLSPAFRPRAVLFVHELPKTRSLKVMRRVVRAIFEGRDPGDLASLVNPTALDELRAAVAVHGVRRQ